MVRLFVGKYAQLLQDIELPSPRALFKPKWFKKVLRYRFTHDHLREFPTHLCDPFSIPTLGASYRQNKVVLLVRDPRDVVVSFFHHKKHRSRVVTGSLSDYLARHCGGIDCVIQYLNMWAGNMPEFNLRVIKYEDLVRVPEETYAKIVEFCGIPMRRKKFLQAVGYVSFDSMRSLEESRTFTGTGLARIKGNHPDRFKVRKGKIGGYREECTLEDISKLDRRIRFLDPVYGYE